MIEAAAFRNAWALATKQDISDAIYFGPFAPMNDDEALVHVVLTRKLVEEAFK